METVCQTPGCQRIAHGTHRHCCSYCARSGAACKHKPTCDWRNGGNRAEASAPNPSDQRAASSRDFSLELPLSWLPHWNDGGPRLRAYVRFVAITRLELRPSCFKTFLRQQTLSFHPDKVPESPSAAEIYRHVREMSARCPRHVRGRFPEASASEAMAASPSKLHLKTSEEEQHECRKCRLPKPLEQGRKHGLHFLCKKCESLERMVARTLGDVEQLKKLSKDRQEAFFREHSEKPEHERTNWQTVRACLVSQLVVEVTSEWDSGEVGEWLPESVWVTRGFLSESVKKCDSRECPKLGTVYQVPVHHDNYRQLRKDVETTLLTREEECRKKKTQRKDKATTGETGEQEPTCTWNVPEALKPQAFAAAASGKGKAAAKAKGKAAAVPSAASAARAAEKTQRVNTQLNCKAQRALADLTQASTGLQKLCKQLEKREDVEVCLKEALQSAYLDLQPWLQACSSTTLQFSALKGQETQPLLPELPFTPEDLKNKLKTLKSLRGEVPRKEKAAAAPAADKLAAAETAAVGPNKRRRTKAPAK
ncbi:hypothetical protein AK812_SmicGene4070 [Symbiodinium microadriaticum]|uniref:Uncharacterized protein n=2 Tax=Symbiodinium microadriaticum TaxID=2951 RepID=A0A1Q9EXD8_SYMMI|nr:hypothetical protein AK812_SmicGene4070 [Symbiodinium microadriaticum]